MTEALSDAVPLSLPIDSSHSAVPAQSVSEVPKLGIPAGGTNNVAPPVVSEDGVDHPTVTPQRIKHDRPVVGDWVGTWWTKGKPKVNRPPSTLSTNESVRFLSASETSSISSEAGVSASPTASNGVQSKSHRRRSAMSVFGSLGISISGSSSSSAISKSIPAAADPVAVDRKPQSSSSSPIQTNSPSLAAPHLTTSLEPSIVQTPSAESEPAFPEDTRQGTSLRAITNATRVMTSDPASVLADQGRETGPLVARLALQLISHARDKEISFRERPKEKKIESSEKLGPVATLSLSHGIDVTTTLNRALTGQGAGSRLSKARATSFILPLGSPLFAPFMSQSKKPPNTVDGLHKPHGVISEHGSSAGRVNGIALPPPPSTRKPASVPLESIIPETAKPPTQYLSRMYTPLTSRDFQFTIPLPNSATRFTIYYDNVNQQPLTDRYGFMYDVAQYDVLLLIRAKECGNTAPACLTGVKIADRKEDNSWPDDDGDKGGNGAIEIVKGKCPCNGDTDSTEDVTPTLQNSQDPKAIHKLPQRSRAVPRSSSQTRQRSPMVNASTSSIPSYCNSSVLSVNANTPRHACAATIKRLLDELTAIHDQRQTTQRKEWDVFVKQRSMVKLPKTNVPSTTASLQSSNVGAALILGLGTACEEEELSHSEGLIAFAQLGLSSNRDERREFGRLVRSGIPLVYRSKVWLECSGGLEMREPGLFHELLAGDGQGSVIAEIEKDVSRTMPLNIFFGGDGVGVDKLRRVLRAYSW